MSARKNVNQSRPRSLADDGADGAAGAADERVTFVWRSSRPPANSRASVDTPTSPPPRGICGVGPSAECPPAFGLPSSSRGKYQHAKGGDFENPEFRSPPY